jgi:hypothetical protein
MGEGGGGREGEREEEGQREEREQERTRRSGEYSCEGVMRGCQRETACVALAMPTCKSLPSPAIAFCNCFSSCLVVDMIHSSCHTHTHTYCHTRLQKLHERPHLLGLLLLSCSFNASLDKNVSNGMPMQSENCRFYQPQRGDKENHLPT